MTALCFTGHQMAPRLTEVEGICLQLATHLSNQRDERLSWPGWLTCKGWLTHISGYPSATGQAQERKVWKTDVLRLFHAIII